MNQVAADISMSLDGFITGPNPGIDSGLGDGGEALHGWVFNSHESPEDRRVLETAGERSGAVIMGRRTFDFVDGPNGWNQEINYSYDHETPTQPPFFVLTHSVPEKTRHQSGFTFITEGLPAAIEAARKAAGDKEVTIMAGADVIGQALESELLDELRIHLSPVLLGEGTPLFARLQRRHLLTQVAAVVTDNATHLTYRRR